MYLNVYTDTAGSTTLPYKILGIVVRKGCVALQAECDITLPLVDLVDFRYVLMNTFQGAHTEIASLKFSLRLIISGLPHSRSTDIRREEKKSGHQSKPAQSLCTVCEKFSHDSKACQAKSSPYADLTPSAYVSTTAMWQAAYDKAQTKF